MDTTAQITVRGTLLGQALRLSHPARGLGRPSTIRLHTRDGHLLVDSHHLRGSCSRAFVPLLDGAASDLDFALTRSQLPTLWRAPDEGYEATLTVSGDQLNLTPTRGEAVTVPRGRVDRDPGSLSLYPAVSKHIDAQLAQARPLPNGQARLSLQSEAVDVLGRVADAYPRHEITFTETTDRQLIGQVSSLDTVAAQILMRTD